MLSESIPDLSSTHSQITEKKKDETSLDFLFDRHEFANYFSQIDSYRTLALKKNDAAAAKTGLLQLTTDYPHYPDAFITLGEIYAKVKDQSNAIVYYQRASTLCPFNNNLTYLLALQRKQPANPELTLEQCLLEARTEQQELQLFKQEHHLKLRKIIIPLRLINTGKLLRDDLDEDSNYTDITLTNGAVVEAYYGNKAFKQKRFSIAKYYYQKALLKYEHDFISATRVVEISVLSGEVEKSLADINEIIKKYNYALSYTVRANIYLSINDGALAVKDIETCLSLADKSDMELLKSRENNVLQLLNIEEVSTTITNDNSTIDVMKLNQKISTSFGDDIKKIIQELDKILKTHPAKVLAYTVRGDAKDKRGDIKSALLDYSLALWFAFGAQIPEIYYKRSCLNLMLGEFNAANYDLNNALYGLQAEDKNDDVSALLAKFSGQCLIAGDIHLQNGNFYVAEKIYASGIIRKPTVQLYLQLAVVLGIQRQYHGALSILAKANQMQGLTLQIRAEIQKNIKLFSAKQSKFNLQKSYNLKSFEIKRAKININYLEADEFYGNDALAEIAEVKQSKPKPRQLPKKTSLPIKRSGRTTTGYIHTLLTSESSESEPEIIVKPELVTTITTSEKNSARNEKRKQRKAKLKSLRTRTSKTPDSNESKNEKVEDDPVTYSSTDIPSVVTALPVPSDKVELLDAEKLIFNMLKACRADPQYKDSRIYITGGWALSRARQHYCKIPLPNSMCDIDIVTDLPYSAIQKYCPLLIRIQQVNGLFKGKIDNIRVDVVSRESLKILFRDAKSRDFLPIYIDENGRILDPTGFVIAQLQEGILKSACPVSEVFKRDPLTILRAIYISTKLNLIMTDLKRQIQIDKKLLVPNLEQDLFHPYRFNNLLRKVFSQGFASINYELLRQPKLGLFAVLFPDINSALEEHCDFMSERMKNTDSFTWPKLEIIYANMITCAVMGAVNALLPEEINKRLAEINLIMGEGRGLNADGLAMIKLEIEEKIIKATAADIMRNSLLFQNRFGSLDNLYGYLFRSIQEWKYFQNEKHYTSQEQVAAASPSYGLR
jgi:tRNA nucleotidyltransferase/poly(A) polymerase